MSLKDKIKTLETQFTNLEIQIAATRNDASLSEAQKDITMVKLTLERSTIISELSQLRRMDYDNSQIVDMDYDR
jgi:hypothetical protein